MEYLEQVLFPAIATIGLASPAVQQTVDFIKPFFNMLFEELDVKEDGRVAVIRIATFLVSLVGLYGLDEYNFMEAIGLQPGFATGPVGIVVGACILSLAANYIHDKSDLRRAEVAEKRSSNETSVLIVEDAEVEE